MLRSKLLNNAPEQGECVVYVMSRDQRVTDNSALLEAQAKAIALGLPLAVIFCLKPAAGYRTYEQFHWMLTGLKQLEKALADYDIPFIMLLGDPQSNLKAIMHHTKPAAIYFDMNPLRGPRKLQKVIANDATCAVYVVDAHNVIPIWETSQKQEYAARTIRPKMHRLLQEYLVEPSVLLSHPHGWPGVVKKLSELQADITQLLGGLKKSGQVLSMQSGEAEAHKILRAFITMRLAGYAERRNDPSEDGQSELSPYLHFGQLSALRVALEVELAVAEDSKLRQDADAFLEELIVRRELSDNYCYYNQNYDSLDGAANWAKLTLAKHADDKREIVYTYTQLEAAQTHDDAWNAAQKQMTETGKMHGYMRMYWAKKVLEWTESPEQAIKVLIQLNDTYSLDGGDPNGYVGILWSVAGLHDRPWFERPVYGTIRYMNYNGLRRKFDLARYISQHTP